MSRRPLIAGNWKMTHNRAATRGWCADYQRLRSQGEGPTREDTELTIAAPFTSIQTLAEAGIDEVGVGAQNLHWETSGAFTGETSPGMLVELGCRFVIVGHSERRHVFGESDERISRKALAASEAGLVPYLCVGETEEQRESGRTEVTIEGQLQAGLGAIRVDDPRQIVIAYEPVWAIGTGKTATSAQAQEAHHFLRAILSSMTTQAIASEVRILYGGSVKPNNAEELAKEPDVDGFLIGGASLEAASFLAIARAFDG